MRCKLLLLCMTGGLTGCMVGPNYKRPDVPAPPPEPPPVPEGSDEPPPQLTRTSDSAASHVMARLR